MEEHVTELSSLQQLLYASDSHAVLLIFQAMDAAGKDGAIKHVMSGVNPLEGLKMNYPKTNVKHRHELLSIRKQLTK